MLQISEVNTIQLVQSVTLLSCSAFRPQNLQSTILEILQLESRTLLCPQSLNELPSLLISHVRIVIKPMRVYFFLPSCIFTRHQSCESDISEASIHICQDVAIADETVQLTCNSAILTCYEICSQKCLQHVRRNVVHVADWCWDDRKTTSMRTCVQCLLITAVVLDCCYDKIGQCPVNQSHSITINRALSYCIIMTESQSISFAQLGRLAAIASLSLALNHIIQKALNPKKKAKRIHRVDNSQGGLARCESMIDIINDEQLKSKDLWGSLQLDNVGEDALLQELEIMTKIVCPFVKVNNLIADLQLHNPKTFPCPLLAHTIKRKHDQPFLMPQALVPPGEFVIENCVFRAGQNVETEKKFMRAGPRATQYFDPKTVRADVVCLGKVCPGVNNIIRELAILLKEIYHAEVVTGIKFGFKGYYTNNMIDLTPQIVETIHHRGGSFLGVSRAPFLPEKIVDSLVDRGVNQLYLIGGNDTIKHTIQIYKEIKRRHLNIAICVNLKAINKDTAYFDTCFGFESAVEETQRFIEEGYALSKSNFNSVVLVKVPGRYSGFLAMDAVRAARNANICLVPEFSFDLYGENGLLRYVAERVKLKGYCIIVYSEGASYAVRDIPNGQYQQILRKKEDSEQSAFDIFFKQEVERELKHREFNPFNVYLFDSQNAVRTVPANSFDTKLCCQIALCSIQGLMCGYTNFAIGHLKNRVAMVPIEQMISADKYCLRPYEEHWQRLLATTGQPSFLNQEHQLP